jgi:MurNAc alpha-1-phosphate uridylyltransferase
MTSFSFKCISLKPGIMGHVVLVPNPEHNPNGDFCLDGDRVTISNNQRYTFSGISFFSINCFKQSSKRYFSLADLLNEYIDKEMITGELFQGDWLDIGTADRLAQAEKVCTKKSNE